MRRRLEICHSMPALRKSTPAKDSKATIGFEAKLWFAADKLPNNMDAAEYKAADNVKRLK